MNKLFTKIAALALGMTMATGVGVAVASSGKEASPAYAADYIVTPSNVGWTTSGAAQSGTPFTGIIVSTTQGAHNTSNDDFRVYASNTLTVSSSIGNISTLTFTFSGSYNGGWSSTTFSPSAASWTSATTSKQARIKSLTVSIAAATTYTVTYDANGGTGTVPTATTSAAAFNLPSSADLTRNGYILNGWADNDHKADGGTAQYALGASYTPTADITLYAHWIEAVNVTYVSGDHSSSANHVVKVAKGSSHSLLTYAETGFVVDSGWVFKKWRIDSTDYNEGTSITVNSNTTVTAIYEEFTGFTLVTDASKLVDGTTFILLHESNSIAAGALNGGVFPLVTASVSGNTASSDDATVFTLGGTAGAWTIKFGDNYLGKTGSTGTSFNTSSSVSTGYHWTITISDGKATMKTESSGTRAISYNYNNGNDRFGPYTPSATYTLPRMFAIIPSSATYSVTYDANGATSGTAPEDATDYEPNSTVTVLGNTGSLAKTGFTWNGWNTKADGSGQHYAATSTFSIEENTTLYAEWVKSLDAISSIGGSVTATISKAGTYDWDYSNLTVTGTLSGATGQDVKSYVDLSSTTPIPSSIGPCTVSVTATKKSTVPGSASPVTNNSISGDVGAAMLTYSLTLSYTDMTQGLSYANENAHAKQSKATCSGHDDIAIDWASNQVQWPSGENYYMQFQASNGYIYNTTELPGTITDITLNKASGDSQTYDIYYGDSEHPTSGSTVGGKFFTVAITSNRAGKIESVVVTFEVSDKPKVQLVASDMNLDVTSGITTPTITDGTSAVTGYTLVSADDYIASITNDNRVQPTGYGKVVVSVSKAEDSGHIYLATTFTVTVGDSSKEVSAMEFVAKTDEGSATADDGIVWTVTANQSENDFSDVYGINFGTNNNKVSSLTLTTPADEERIIKNVVVEAMSAADGSTITVSVGGTPFTCSKSNSLTGNVTTFNFSGHVSGAITITMSGTASSKYGVKSIHVLYVGDEAESFAATFLGAVSCDSSGVNKPSFNFQPDGETRWTWALLAAEYNELGPTDKAKFAVGATGVSARITQCVNKYDYIVGKYYKTGLDKSFTDFMLRDPSPVGSSRAILDTIVGESGNTVAIIAVISMISITAIGGYFFLRKRKEEI